MYLVSPNVRAVCLYPLEQAGRRDLPQGRHEVSRASGYAQAVMDLDLSEGYADPWSWAT